jgi:hypothetical protein
VCATALVGRRPLFLSSRGDDELDSGHGGPISAALLAVFLVVALLPPIRTALRRTKSAARHQFTD